MQRSIQSSDCSDPSGSIRPDLKNGDATETCTFTTQDIPGLHHHPTVSFHPFQKSQEQHTSRAWNEKWSVSWQFVCEEKTKDWWHPDVFLCRKHEHAMTRISKDLRRPDWKGKKGMQRKMREMKHRLLRGARAWAIAGQRINKNKSS